MTTPPPQGRPVGENVRQACELLDVEGPMTLPELAKALDLLQSYARKYLNRAEGYGLVYRDGGKFRAVPGWAARADAGRSPRLSASSVVRGIHTRPLNSVWELADGAIRGAWPPEGAGRHYAPLGPWVEEATNDNDRSAA